MQPKFRYYLSGFEENYSAQNTHYLDRKGRDTPARPNKQYRASNRTRYNRLRRLIFIERLDYTIRWEDIVRGSDDEILAWVHSTVERQRRGLLPPPRPLPRHLRRNQERPSELQARSNGFLHLPEPQGHRSRRDQYLSDAKRPCPTSSIAPINNSHLIPLDQAIDFFTNSPHLPSPSLTLPPLQGVAQASIEDRSPDLVVEPPTKRVKYDDYKSGPRFKFTKQQVVEEYKNIAGLKEVRETQPPRKRAFSPYHI
ncbi:hypothetical protein QAD02_019116 [Eretmocerus hayati]|uniref:Uncharacterized protein n=1 Tax=Eretmocerus hayati TaxID=131215 RepID=A0ACC2PJ44_9HYME|nr:hypothetical protein QAD02_019116 [Eretmocerus hayati]